MPIAVTPDNLVALVTLTALEIVLGIDNIVFISILADRLPPAERDRARVLGLAMAMITRIALLFSLAWIIGLTAPLFEVLGHPLSGRDLILIGGGLFLLAKSTAEIHDKLEGEEHAASEAVAATLSAVVIQIGLLDIVFSLDSVITAVGMARELWVMVAAIVVAILVMMWSSAPISDFVHRHPTVQMLALSFLLLIGTSLIAEGLGLHIPKGYIYFAMGFSVFVEVLNLQIRGRRAEPLKLRQRIVKGQGSSD